MINQLLALARPLIILDTETTGVDPEAGSIVEIGFQVWDATGMTTEWRALVNPGVPIPAAATKVHGITDADMQKCRDCRCYDDDVAPDRCRCEKFKPAYTFRQLAPNLAKGFSGCDFAGKGVRFDLRILAAEMRRASQPWSFAGARIIDVGRLEQLAVPRSLSDLYLKYTGSKLEGAHGALVDAKAALEVVEAQLRAHQSLPRDLDALHALQWPGELDEGGKFRMVDGVATCQFGKHRGRAMRDIPPDYWNWILSTNMPDDVKKLASDAKLGKFPEVR